MEVLNFIFGLGIAFSIFGFIWGLIMLFVNFIRGSYQQGKEVQGYVLRIIKYFLLVSVSANYIIKYQDGNVSDTTVGLTNMILGVIVMALYLMGKLRNRAMLSQLSKNPVFARFSTAVDPKVERYLLSGSLVYFIFCLQYPAMVDNSVVNWFTESIVSIYNTPVIGWVFAVIAFFFLINIVMRGANVIGSLLTGQPLNRPSAGGGFGNFQGGGNSNPFEQFREQQKQGDDFVDYEDVTEEEEEGSDEDEKGRIN